MASNKMVWQKCDHDGNVHLLITCRLFIPTKAYMGLPVQDSHYATSKTTPDPEDVTLWRRPAVWTPSTLPPV